MTFANTFLLGGIVVLVVAIYLLACALIKQEISSFFMGILALILAGLIINLAVDMKNHVDPWSNRCSAAGNHITTDRDGDHCISPDGKMISNRPGGWLFGEEESQK